MISMVVTSTKRLERRVSFAFMAYEKILKQLLEFERAALPEGFVPKKFLI